MAEKSLVRRKNDELEHFHIYVLLDPTALIVSSKLNQIIKDVKNKRQKLLFKFFERLLQISLLLPFSWLSENFFRKFRCLFLTFEL